MRVSSLANTYYRPIPYTRILQSQPIDFGRSTVSKNLTFYEPTDVLAGDSTVPVDDRLPLQQTLDWLVNFVAQPHPLLPNRTALCPPLKAAMAQNKVNIGTYRFPNPDAPDDILKKQLKHQILNWTSYYQKDWTKYRQAPMDPLYSSVLIFPNLPLSKTESVLQATKREMKAVLNARRGLTLGSFFPDCNDGSTDNAALKVFQSPVPMLSIRPYVKADFRFISNPAEAAAFETRFGKPKSI